MVALFEAVDALFMSFFTWISYFVQRLAGKTNFFLAKCALHGVAINCFLWIENYWFPVLEFETPLVFVLLPGIVAIGLLRYIYFCDQMEEDPLLRFMIPRLKHRSTTFFRVLCVGAACVEEIYFLSEALASPRGFTFFKILFHQFTLCWTSFVYFLSVKPLPPEESKVSRLMEKLSAGFKKVSPIGTR